MRTGNLRVRTGRSQVSSSRIHAIIWDDPATHDCKETRIKLSAMHSKGRCLLLLYRWRRLFQRNDPALYCQGGGFRAVLSAELFKHVAHVQLDRDLRDTQRCGDLFVA